MASRATAGAQAVPVGAYFGLPGFTQPFEQYENLQGVVSALSLTSQTPWNPSGSFQKTDIVKWWELEIDVNFTTTVTGATLSTEAPYNFLQALKLKLQGQYSPLEVDSGFDAAFMQMYRPMRGAGQNSVQNLDGTNVAGTYANSAIPGTNLVSSGIATNPASGTHWKWLLEIPGGLYIDDYWDLAIDGTLLPNANGVVAPMGAWVSPQYMGGGERVVVPQFNYAALTAGDADSGPLTGTTAGAASVTVNARRVGYYASAEPAELPPVFNWQYRRSSKRVPLGAVSKADIPITEYGQLLSTYVRIFDAGYLDLAAGAKAVTKAQLLYGSNLPRFDDDYLTMQQRFIAQHGFLPPQSVVIWDMMANTSGSRGLSNDFRVLNTLTNANTHFHLEFASTLGSTAYAVVGTELLVPVATQ
jgi:hypothetical protein